MPSSSSSCRSVLLILLCVMLGYTPVTSGFIRGDVNGSGAIELLPDCFMLMSSLFSDDAPTIPCRYAADVNADGGIDMSDFIFLATFGFATGPEPPAPFPDCGAPDDDYDPLPSVTCEDDSGCV